MTDRDRILQLPDAELSALCELRFTKGSGNGGQKRNKSSSAVQVVLPEFGVEASDCTERSQHRNRAKALRKLKMALALKQRELPAKIPERMECALTHDDYPLWTARLLDLLEECDYDYRAAAERGGVSPSALLKKLRRDPALWDKVQTERKARGLHALNAK